MDHKKFIMRLIEFVCGNQGTILINEYEVNGARHSKSEVSSVTGTVSASISLDAVESVAEFAYGNQPRFRDYHISSIWDHVAKVEANRGFVRIHTEKGGAALIVSYNEWNYTDEFGFGSTMPWETEEEFKSRCDKINAGLGMVPA